MPSRAEEIGRTLGLDVEGSRARHAAARARYRAAISDALDRLMPDLSFSSSSYSREPIPYAAAGMSYPFERREVDGRGEETSEAPASGVPSSVRGVAGSVGDPGAPGARRRAVPVPVRVPERARRVG